MMPVVIIFISSYLLVLTDAVAPEITVARFSKSTIEGIATYDIPLGDDLTITCTGNAPSFGIEPNTYLNDDNQRFKDRQSLQHSGSSITLSLQQARATDTGRIACKDGSETSTIYLFINDPNNLAVPLDNVVTLVAARGANHILPCLPTHSQSRFTALVVANSDIFKTTTRSVISGVTTNHRLRPGFKAFSCTIEYNGRSSTSSITLHLVSFQEPDAPTTDVLSQSHHYLPGDQLVLNCSSAYSQLFTFEWTYPSKIDGQTSNTVNISSVGQKCDGCTKWSATLTVANLKPTDSGIYRCDVVPSGKPTSLATGNEINITVFDEAFLDMADGPFGGARSVNQGEPAVFELMFRAHPRPEVTWFYKDRMLETTNDNKYSVRAAHSGNMNSDVFEPMLSVRDVQYGADDGEYRAEIKVASVNPQSILWKLSVNVPPLISVEYKLNSGVYNPVTEITAEQFILPGEKALLRCGERQGKPTPSLIWQWQSCTTAGVNCQESQAPWVNISTTVMSPDVRRPNKAHYTEVDGDIVVLSVEGETSGRYRCVAQNAAGTVKQGLGLFVSEAAMDNGIGFSVPSVFDITEDEDLSLSCYGFRWKCGVNEVKIMDSAVLVNDSETGDYLFQSSTGNSWVITLSKKGITAELNNTEYVCTCKDGVGNGKTKINVKNYAAPLFVETPDSLVKINHGDTQSFVCLAEGSPMPAVTWYKDGQVVLGSDTIKFSNDNTNMTLFRAAPSESGNYVCNGTTTRESIFVNFTLNVQAIDVNPPEPILEDYQIAMIIIIIVVFMVIAIIVTIFCVRRYCRKKYVPHGLLLPSKDQINPEIPLDEQTDALPYDVGWEFNTDKLKLGMLLGQGAFGRVLKADAFGIEAGVSISTVAVKTVRDHNDMEQIKALISELKILIHIGQHLNIVNLLGACTKDIKNGQLMVIVEYCRYGNLRSHLIKHRAHFNPTMEDIRGPEKMGVKLGASVDIEDDYLNEGPSELHTEEKPITTRDILCWSFQIARGMQYLSSIDYIHRDLAARNVLLCDDNIVKICDFGLAKDIYKYKEYKKETDGPLPIKWMALESLTHKIFDTKTDVWSYGVTLWELFALAATPYPGVELDETFIDRLEAGYRMEKTKHAPQDIYNVMLNCWHPDPNKRPTFEELDEIVGNLLQEEDIQHLADLEEPYLRQRDSRADVPMRKTSARRRNLSEFDSDYLPSIASTRQSTADDGATSSDYYNTGNKNKWKKETATSEEKLPLQVSIDEDVDMPKGHAPAPSPWERQSHLGRRAAETDDHHDTASFKSFDSDGARPPSYNYVMKKSDNPNKIKGNGESAHLLVDMSAESDVLANTSNDPSYIETTC